MSRFLLDRWAKFGLGLAQECYLKGGQNNAMQALSGKTKTTKFMNILKVVIR